MAKPVNPFLYDQAFKLREDLTFSPFVRLPVDGSDADLTLMHGRLVMAVLRDKKIGGKA